MKKLYSCLVACFAALLLAFPLLGIKTAAACGEGMHMLESILPNEQQREAGSTTTAPDATGGLPFMPGEETERTTDGAGQGQRAVHAADEDISVGAAVLVVGLALITLVVAVIYVFRGRGERPHRE